MPGAAPQAPGTAAPEAAARSVGFFAPSGYLPDPEVMERAAHFFSARGWRVSAGDTVFAREQRFAGPDDLRAAELQGFATDRSLDVAIAARGGYGLTRILGDFDYEAIAAARLPLVGYSDFTAFNLALLAQAGGISFQGPAASDFRLDGAEQGVDASGLRFNQEQFFSAISQGEHCIEFATGAAAAPYEGRELRGRLWGGNLAMVCSLLGTKYFPRVRGGILFLEDVNEPAYRIERMLLQLLQAGVLERQKAVLLGDFSSVPSLPNDNGYDLASVWAALRARCAVPVFDGLPMGHARRRAMLAVGAPARLNVLRAGEGGAPFAGGAGGSNEPQRGSRLGPGGWIARLQYWDHPVMRPGSKSAARRSKVAGTRIRA
jgi:muramoyltetrapeptide carboxypeptidase